MPMEPGMPSQPEPGFASEDQNSLEITVDLPWGICGVGMGFRMCPLSPALSPH